MPRQSASPFPLFTFGFSFGDAESQVAHLQSRADKAPSPTAAPPRNRRSSVQVQSLLDRAPPFGSVGSPLRRFSSSSVSALQLSLSCIVGDPRDLAFQIIKLVAALLVGGTPDMSIRESAGAHLATSRALETCLHLAILGSSSGVPARRQTPQSPSIHLKMTVLLMREWRCLSLAEEEGNMHYALHCNDPHHVTWSSVHLENAGISSSGDATCIPDLDVLDSMAVISFCQKQGIGLVVVGPEAPLVSGLANDLVKAGIPTFGPSSEAAALEGSKDFMKNLCDKYGIPTAKYKTFTDPSSAKLYIKEQGAPIVVKADGLAAGKGVIVAMTVEEAYEAVDSMLVEGVFGSAGCKVIIEDYLEGEEASFFALVDGENAIALESAQDHKRVGDGDTGPNTGGMGAYSPAPILTQELQSLVMQSIILPTVQGMAVEGCKFVGVLYAGLMIEKKSGMPKLIEYNVRFGDPECQVLMVRLESDLVQVLLSACRGELSRVTLDWSPGSAMVVVMASNGYPGTYEKGSVIQNLEEAELVAPSVKIFHAGTAFDSDGNFVATGGRVLGVTAKGRNLEEAHERAYQAVEAINWPGGFYRHDIGWRALPKKQFAKQN
ncbi:hypothetical protein NL676_016073 [Syzygium grande]|nr:hypothetical protein NL676_016073 [Syzygium grande]